MKLGIVLLLIALTGCVPDVIVRDTAGHPVHNAKVIGISLSYQGQSTTTDSRGYASIPWALQPTTWIQVEKEGFHTTQPIPLENVERPILVNLKAK